jgi:hypothetical protein
MLASKVTALEVRGVDADLAARESWFSALKSDLSERFTSYADAKEHLFDYTRVFRPERGARLSPTAPPAVHRLAVRVELLLDVRAGGEENGDRVGVDRRSAFAGLQLAGAAGLARGLRRKRRV